MSVINLITQLQIYDPILAMIIIIPLMIFIEGFRKELKTPNELKDTHIQLDKKDKSSVDNTESDTQMYNNIITDVKLAMKTMGFKKDIIEDAVNAALRESPNQTTENLLKTSLKHTAT